MTAGFQVFTRDGSVLQIDTESIVYCLRKSGQVKCSQNVFENSANFKDFVGMVDITGFNAPIVAVKSSIACAVEIVKPTGQFLPYGRSGRTYLKVTCGTPNASIQYYVFDQWNAPGGNAGLELFDASGNRTFHSDWYLMDVVGFLDASTSKLPFNRDTEAYLGSVSGNVALHKTITNLWTRARSGYAPETYKDGIRVSNGGARLSWVYAGAYGGSAGWNYRVDAEVMVIDVSKLPSNYG